MTKSEARELAFAIGFERLLAKESVDEIINAAGEVREVSIPSFTKKISKGVEANEEAVDAIIERNLKGWKLSRLSTVAHAILRIAVYEIYYEDNIPVGVSINEAVELSKTYGDESDARFVNGVLSDVAKEKANNNE